MIDFHPKLTALVVCVLVSLCTAVPNNCKQWKQQNPGFGSGEYLVSNGHGKTHKVYCEFYNNHGYMFIPKDTTVTPNMDLLAPVTSEVLVRHLRDNNRQYESTVSQMSTHSTTPLSIQYNANVNYNSPQNKNTLGPYIYLGFLPISIAKARTLQGYRVNGNDVTFTNCDSNPNSYMAFFFDNNNASPNGYYNKCNCYNDAVMKVWATQATPTSHVLPQEYFMTVEMHMGGCGGYSLSGYKSQAEIRGAALGIKFGCSEPFQNGQLVQPPTSGNHYSEIYSFTCDAGFYQDGTSVTCQDSGVWGPGKCQPLATSINGKVFRIINSGDGKWWHFDGSVPKKHVTTLWQPMDNFVKFKFESVATGRYKIREMATNKLIYDGGNYLSTIVNTTPNSDQFWVYEDVDAENKYRIISHFNNQIVRVNEDQRVSSTLNKKDDFSLYSFVPV